MKHKIMGTVLQTVNFELSKGEKIFSERGSMAWMSENIEMDTGAKGGLFSGVKRKLAGESFFLTTFTCASGKGIISFASEFPGKIIEVDISKGREMICQKEAFLCAEEGVELDMILRDRLGAGFFGGEGFILQKLSGKGKAFVELSGEITEINLKKDQEFKVDTGHIAMYEPSVDFDIKVVKGTSNVLFGGEGLFLATLRGPGRVWLQSMPISNLAKKIGKYFRFRRGGRLSGLMNSIGRGV